MNRRAFFGIGFGGLAVAVTGKTEARGERLITITRECRYPLYDGPCRLDEVPPRIIAEGVQVAGPTREDCRQRFEMENFRGFIYTRPNPLA